MTEAWPGTSLDHLLPELPPADQAELIAAACAQVRKMHALGFRDRNSDLRNWLARRDRAGAWVLAKIDSPRYRIVAPGEEGDRFTREDWQRLGKSLAKLGMKLPNP